MDLPKDKLNTSNQFIQGDLVSIFIRTALPIILVMLVNGSFSLVDAYFLGVFIGADALTAVTSTFPLFMLLIGLSVLVSTGFSSVMARLLGAGNTQGASNAFAQAISLALVMSVILIFVFMLSGDLLVDIISNGSDQIFQMSYSYISILIFYCPLMFILSINSDSLRSEGLIGFMTLVSLLSVLLNVIFNYLLIVELEYGVAGSAYGSVLAQVFSIIVISIYRHFKKGSLKLKLIQLSLAREYWADFLKLGAPSSLTYLGLALSSGAIIYSLQVWGGNNYLATVGAYGIFIRLMTFIFLPALGLSLAFQTILGNNVGAQQWLRCNQIIKIALSVSLMYSASLQVLIVLMRWELASLFVEDAFVISEVARIIPIATAALFLLGPLMIITMFFQSIGDAKRAGILGLTKIYCFSLPLVFILPFIFSEAGIWYAGPLAEFLALGLTLVILYRRFLQSSNPFGLLFKIESKFVES